MEKYEQYAELSRFVGYEKDTGLFFWKTDFGRKIKAGSKAGSIGGGVRKYIKIGFRGRTMIAHRLAHVIVNGKLPSSKLDVDHKNGNSLDNRWSNICEVKTRSGNLKNIKTSAKSNTGLRGVSKVIINNSEYYDVSMWDDGDRVSRRKFTDFFEACCFRLSEMNRLGYQVY